MELIAIYFLKMLVCSGMLYAYYRFALYNESFHQWNRFYLLVSLALSVLVPFIQIPILETNETSNLALVVSALPWNNNAEVFTKPEIITWQQIAQGIMLIISVVLLLRLLTGIIRLMVIR